MDIITNTFQNKSRLSFNMTSFHQKWKVNEHKTVDVFSEVYSSPEMLCAHQEINALPCETGDNMEHMVASLMVWSDSTQVTQFSNNSMWPFYLSFGNQSKYLHSKPSEVACYHLTYIPKIVSISLSNTHTEYFHSFLTNLMTSIIILLEFQQSKKS